MKRRDSIAPRGTRTDWIDYTIKVLALIGLWQVLTNGTLLLTRWF